MEWRGADVDGSQFFVGDLDSERIGLRVEFSFDAKAFGRHGVCDQPSVKAEILEQQFATVVQQLRLPIEWQEATLGYLLAEDGLAAIMSQRRALRDHLDQVQLAYDRGMLGRQMYLKERRTVERSLTNLNLEANSNLDVQLARKYLTDWSCLWSSLTPLEQRGIARSMLRDAIVENQQIITFCWESPFTPLLPTTRF